LPTAQAKSKTEPKKRTRSIEDPEDDLPIALRRRTAAAGSGKTSSPIDIIDESDQGFFARNELKKDDKFSQLDTISEEKRKQWEKELNEEFRDPGKVVVTTKYNGWTKEKFEMFLRRYVTDNQPIGPSLN
jgi:hypothetical protein